MDRLRKENGRLRAALTDMIEECDRTIRWRKGGMRPATDTSAFAATSLSGVIEIKRRCEWALAVVPDLTEYESPERSS